MPWPWIFIGIAFGGVAMFAGLAVWLVHKASDLFAELRVLGERAGKGAELLGGIQVPERGLLPGASPAEGPWTAPSTGPNHDPDVVLGRRVPTT